MFIVNLKKPELTIENQDGQKGTPEMKLTCPTMVLSAIGPRPDVISTPENN